MSQHSCVFKCDYLNEVDSFLIYSPWSMCAKTKIFPGCRLWTRKEKEIAVVTHSGFLFHTLNAFGNDCHPLVKKEIAKQ